MTDSKPKALFAGMGSWHLGHTAREFEQLGALTGFWVSGSKRSGVSEQRYRRIWDYHLAQKLFYHLPFPKLEEDMRWINLPFYERWIRRQTLPPSTNVVQGPMGSCEALFRLADQSGHKVLKVFDAPNSHPTNLVGYWQRECDLYASGDRVPMCLAARSRINRELEQADLILCPSNFVKDTMVLNGIPAEKCFISHFGVDTSIFVPRAELPVIPTFVSVGSICLRKGHQYLFRAFEELKRQIPEARLICVGGVRPDFKEEWKRWEGTFDHRQSLSHPEIASLLGSATVFVLASVEEGFARVLSEAMACALPIIATYESGATTVIRDGEEGMIIPARNVPALTEAMRSIANHPQMNLEMGRKALLAGGASNTWTDYAKRLHAEYDHRLSIKPDGLSC
jgi:glycosyltransferase involved in cell wall biosynthesis